MTADINMPNKTRCVF